MLNFNGKRTGRLRLPGQLNMDPEMIAAIAERAERNMRPIGNEIIRLLMVGLYYDGEMNVHEQFSLFAPSMKPLRTTAHTHAQRRTA